MDKDLFDKPAPLTLSQPVVRGKHYVEPVGYYGKPGTGPSGKRCWDCKYYAVVEMAKTYPKCGKNRANWTGGRRSDILARSPSCQYFEDKPPHEGMSKE